MKNIYKKFILVGITSLSLISCNIIDNQHSASIETKLEDIKLSNNIRNYTSCIEDGRNFDRIAATKPMLNVIFFILLPRGVFPRIRVDMLLNLGWTKLIGLAFVNIFIALALVYAGVLGPGGLQ